MLVLSLSFALNVLHDRPHPYPAQETRIVTYELSTPRIWRQSIVEDWPPLRTAFSRELLQVYLAGVAMSQPVNDIGPEDYRT
jgi:hypothetical protein